MGAEKGEKRGKGRKKERETEGDSTENWGDFLTSENEPARLAFPYNHGGLSRCVKVLLK